MGINHPQISAEYSEETSLILLFGANNNVLLKEVVLFNKQSLTSYIESVVIRGINILYQLSLYIKNKIPVFWFSLIFLMRFPLEISIFSSCLTNSYWINSNDLELLKFWCFSAYYKFSTLFNNSPLTNCLYYPENWNYLSFLLMFFSICYQNLNIMFYFTNFP